MLCFSFNNIMQVYTFEKLQNTKKRHIIIYMNQQFVFPLGFSDLEKPNNFSNYTVGNDVTLEAIKEMSEHQILRRIKNTTNALYQNIGNINNPERFDFLYFLIKAFSENIEFKSSRVLQSLCQLIEYVLQIVLKGCSMSNLQNVETLRISFKMTMFLTFFFISSTLIKKRATQTDLMTQAINKQANKNKKNKKNTSQMELNKTVFDKQRSMIELIKHTLEINFVELWQKNQVDSEFFKYYTDMAVKILESTLAKESDTRDLIFNIFDIILNKKPDIFKQIQINLVNLIYQGDVVDNLVQFFSKAETAELQSLCRQTTALTVSYLTQKASNQNGQSQSIKNTKQFLSKLSDLIPKTFYNNLSCYIQLYDNQSYLLRNAITDILANIIRKVLTNNQNQDNTKAKQKYINTLLQRIYDKNSHCRSHVVGVLSQLVYENMVPKNLLIHLLRAGIDRLKDHSVLTRKRAIQLITNLFKIYQFLFCKKGQIFKTIQVLDREIAMSEDECQNLVKQIQSSKAELPNACDSDTLEDLQKEIKIDTKKLNHLQAQIEVYKENKQVLALAGNMIQTITFLLNSKNFSDVLEVIKLFIFLKQVGINNIEVALVKIRMLIFSKEKQVKDEVMNCFVNLYLGDAEASMTNLIKLFSQATLQDQTCLEEILQLLTVEGKKRKEDYIPREVYEKIWNRFIDYMNKKQATTEKRACLKIMRIIFNADEMQLKQNYLVSLFNIIKSYVDNKNPDYIITREIAKIIQKCPNKLGNNLKNFVVAQMYIIINGQGTEYPEWYSATQQLLTTIYSICESPEQYSQLMIGQMNNKLSNNPKQSSLAHFIFVLSHSCLKLLIHLDNLESKLKLYKQEAEKTANNRQGEEELDKMMGGIEGDFETRLQRLLDLAERIIEDQFIKQWLQVIESIVNKAEKGGELERVAVLAYCKFMCISQTYCQKHLKKLFQLLNKPNMDYIIKNNIIIAIGDLLHRFPNIVEPHKRYLYQNLHDPNPRVRKATLTVLNHLILNDMIKIKGQICDIALLFEDQNPQLQSLAKQFFHQINKKDPKFIYNELPDAITRLSNIQQGLYGRKITEKSFQSFAKNIIGLLEKDKYSQSLIEKLCSRFGINLNPVDLRNTAYCLSQLNINEKGVRKILENFDVIREKLIDPEIMNSFRSLANKLKKMHKPELKPLIEQLQSKLSSNDQIFNAQNVKRRNQRPKKKKPVKKKGPKRQTDKMEEQSSENNVPRTPLQRERRAIVRKKNNFIVQSSQQSEEYSQTSSYN